MSEPATIEAPRFIVGIDLGTTNCSAAFVDTAQAAWSVRDFLIPQLIAASTVEPRETLPSFHYQAAEGEFAPGALNLPWSQEKPSHAVGIFARDHGAAVPGRLVSSAKSWLCHPGVDRTAPLLPWHAAPDVERLSPVDVAARYLEHIRRAWDHAHPEHPLAGQEVVLTVPASFDEVARELTVEAARRAGLVRLTLVEEPQAAFYAWISAQGEEWQSQVEAGQKILVCDIGGGTTDFTLIRVRPAGNGKVLFHRIAVGQHLILGGDNLDLAVAHHIERKVTDGGKLPPHQWGPLLRSSRILKETLLGENPPATVTINLAAGGSKLIGGARQVEVARDEIHQLLLEGFLPAVGLEDKPIARRSGFQEFGLPYAPDPAVTRYLAAFLAAHRDGCIDEDNVIKLHHDPARPDVVLFNGGFFASPVLRERLLEVMIAWFGKEGSEFGVQGSERVSGKGEASGDGKARKLTTGRSAKSKIEKRKSKFPLHPLVLANDRLDLAVSRGAAYYGMVRRGRGVRITGGLAHSYFIGVETAAASRAGTAQSAICLLPAGIEEGHDVHLQRSFTLLIRQPVEFPLYISATRTADAPGTLVEADPEQLTALPPIRTVLQSGKRSAADTVSVQLHARLTEIGTLELWAQETKGDRQWRLQFDVRSATRAEMTRQATAAESAGVVEEQLVAPAQSLIRDAFLNANESKIENRKSKIPAPPTPASLVKRLELITTLSRNEWPPTLLRSLWETLMDVQENRKLSVDHEARWLSLAGFCLRPGFGLAIDDWRVAQTWRLFPQKVHHPKNELCRAEWWILWRRVAGGLSAGQQLTAAEPLIAALRSRLRPAGAVAQPKTSPFQYGPHESAEVWRLLGSLELLKLPIKEELGQLILDLLPREKAPAIAVAQLFALGRIGSRVPVYGPLNMLVAPEVVERWISRLLEIIPAMELLETQSKIEYRKSKIPFPLVQLARRTDDRYRDISDLTRQAVLQALAGVNAPDHYIQLVAEGGNLEAEEQSLAFGESLPCGLRID